MMSLFLEQNKYSHMFRELELCGSSEIILLEQGKIQKTECLTAQQSEEQFKLSESRLN